MTVPAFVLEDAELREPLRDEKEVADGAGAGECARHVGRPRHLDRRARTGSDRLGQRDQHHSFVIRVVVRGDVPFGVGEIAPEGLHSRHLDPAPVVCRRRALSSADERPLAHEGRAAVLPGVPVQMKLQLAGWIRGDVAPRDRLSRRDRAHRGVQPGRDGVAGVARRAWRIDSARDRGVRGDARQRAEHCGQYGAPEGGHLREMLHQPL